MSELKKARGRMRDSRWHLLTTVSVLTLLGAICGASESEAEDQDVDRPTVWIELGGQLERLSNSQQAFSPPFMASITQANLLSALDVQQPSAYAIGSEGKISLHPAGSDWVFSASVQYGRSSADRHRHQQTANAKVPVNFDLPPPNSNLHFGPIYYYPSFHVRFADAIAKQSETHGVIDFQAGKDVGLGMFSGRGSSVLSVGVRIAQFTSNSNVGLRAEPDVQYPTKPILSLAGLFAFRNSDPHFHDYAGTAVAQRSFRGLGPSVVWDASVPLASESGRGGISIDWGMNAAALFGRQKVNGHHKTIVQSYSMTDWQRGLAQRFVNNGAVHCSYCTYTAHATAHHTNSAKFNRERTVVVPNLGGFAGVSFLYSSAKVSLGYRADFFFGAMDGGIDTRKSEMLGFYGPFASVSVGLGG